MKMNHLAAILAVGMLAAPAGFLTFAPAASAAAAPVSRPAAGRQVTTPPPPLSPAAQSVLGSGGRHICYVAHVQNLGWMSQVCGPAITVGTTGQGLRMEAGEITTP